MNYELTTSSGFEAMYQEWYTKIYNYIFYQTLSKEDTEDLVSTIFMKVALNAHRYAAEKAGFSTWIYTIAKRSLIDFYRARKPVISLDDGENDFMEPSIDFEEQRQQISSENRQIIYTELSSLSVRERMMIYYKYFEGFTNREIAARLEMNESTVGTVLSRALKKLQNDRLRDLI